MATDKIYVCRLKTQTCRTYTSVFVKKYNLQKKMYYIIFETISYM